MDHSKLIKIERPRIIRKASQYVTEPPKTITAYPCDRSPGGLHDFYSEGDYWWPDPDNPAGPYIRRDGETNPVNFVAHRHAMVRLSDIIGTLTSAYLITEDEAYARQAVAHLKAWFVDRKTRMTPHLRFGQAIKGRYTGRGFGIIDTVHLVEVARSIAILRTSPSFHCEDQVQATTWFRTYLTWINAHPYGRKEKAHPSNHGICWSMQAGAFASLVGDKKQLSWIRRQFKTVYLKNQMDINGSFPKEFSRTKSFNYSLFVIDAMAGVAQIASIPKDDLWLYELPDGRGMRKGMEFIVPYIQDKSTWPNKPDIQYWDELPARHPSLLFAGIKYNNSKYLEIWKSLEPDPETDEILRNLPLRYPLLWILPPGFSLSNVKPLFTFKNSLAKLRIRVFHR